MNINNRIIEKRDLTFFQWLNIYKAIWKREFRELPPHKQDEYRKEYEAWRDEVTLHGIDEGGLNYGA